MLQQAQVVLSQAEDLLLVALFFIVFLYPLLLDPTLLFNLSTWLWWVKGFAWIGLLAWVTIRLLVGLPLAPAQVSGATVDAMEQTAPEKEPVSFTAVLVEIPCTLFPCWQPPMFLVQEANTQVQSYFHRLWRRPQRQLFLAFPARRLLPLSSHSPEPSA
ncbi:MAG: hypothetical protein KJ069_29085 [Anaerolineae bacterium]|nr:hypothetical protein [Anaerolineae bacterium]